MNSEVFVDITVALITILGVIVSSYVVPYIQSKFHETEMSKLVDFARKSVEWANQTIPVDQWKRKKTEVMNLVIAFMDEHLKINLSEEQLDVIIEALVNEAKKVIKG